MQRSAQAYGRAQRQEHRALAPGKLDRLAERLLGLTCRTLRVLQDLKLAREPQQLRFPEALSRARRYSKTVRDTFEPIRGLPTHQVCFRGNARQVRQELVRSHGPRFCHAICDLSQALFMISRHHSGPPFERRGPREQKLKILIARDRRRGFSVDPHSIGLAARMGYGRSEYMRERQRERMLQCLSQGNGGDSGLT